MDKYKEEFNEILNGDDLNYENKILPLCSKIQMFIKDEPRRWPFIECEKRKFDIYYETLFHFYISHIDDEIITHIPLKILINLMSYRLIIYFINTIVRTYDEIKRFNEQILETINKIYNNTNYPENISRLVDIVSLPLLEEMSTITFFHYFIGFDFKKENIGIDKQTLLNKLNDKGRVFVNMLYGMESAKDETYVYHNLNERVGLKYLTPDVVKRFRPIEKINNDNQKTRILQQDIKDTNYIILQYNSNTYTLFDKELDKEQALRFVKGALPLYIDKNKILYTTRQIYYEFITSFIDVSKFVNVVTVYDYENIYNTYIVPIYTYHQNNIKTTYLKFVNDIISQLKKNKVLNEQEYKLFEFYLNAYSIEDTFNIDDFNAYVRAYF